MLNEIADHFEIRGQVNAEIEPGVEFTGDPFILKITINNLVENAFKYGVSTKESTSIVIKIHATPNQIAFEATNTIATNISTHLDSTGIGINNAKRRLALLYPGMHQLNITSQDNTYQVSLHINC